MHKLVLVGDDHEELHRTPECYRILEPMIALAQCSKVQRIIVAGEQSIELMFELERCGYAHVASTARPAEQCQVALIDWLGHTFRSLETTLDWLVDFFLRPDAVLVVLTDRQKAQAREGVYTALERRGFSIEVATVRADGSLVSARRRELSLIHKAA
jgi:hypothetical protein